MARTAFAVLVLSVLVAGAFAGIFSNSNSNNNSDEQLQRQHQRQQQQQIQKCSCEQQRQFFNELKQVQQQCLQQCVSSENQPQIQYDSTSQQQQALQTLRQCATNQQYQRQMEETIDCVDQKTQQQQSCNNNNNQQNQQNTDNTNTNRNRRDNNNQQIQNQDSSAKIANHFERMSNKVRQQMEEAYEQQQQQEQQKFGKTLTNQVYDCTAKCVVQKTRQMDTAQKFGCEFQFENEQLKQAVGECHQKHIRRALENVVQCAASKGQQGADEYQQNLKQKNFDADQLYKQY